MIIIIIITLQQLYTFIIIYIVFKLVSSAQQGCIYLYSKKIHAWFKKGVSKMAKKNIILVTY